VLPTGAGRASIRRRACRRRQPRNEMDRGRVGLASVGGEDSRQLALDLPDGQTRTS
jgi:hypothetical protein